MLKSMIWCGKCGHEKLDEHPDTMSLVCMGCNAQYTTWADRQLIFNANIAALVRQYLSGKM